MRLYVLVLPLFSLFACGHSARYGTSSLAAASSGNLRPGVDRPPGKLCTADDPNFDGFRYAEQIAHCQRNVPPAMRDEVAAAYGVVAADYHLYEFDHFIPLNAGGADAVENLWPQPWDQARIKDKLELEIYLGLKDGTLTQAQAVAEIQAWRP